MSNNDADIKLKNNEVRCQSLIENSPFCIHEIDLDGKIISMNPEGLDMLGLNIEKQVVGLAYLDLVAPEERAAVGLEMEKAFKSDKVVFDFKSADNQFFHTKMVSLKDKSGKVIKVLGMTENITQQKEAEVLLKNEVEARKMSEENLIKKINELEIFNEHTVNREIKMIDLKKEVNNLLVSMGEKEKYEIVT